MINLTNRIGLTANRKSYILGIPTVGKDGNQFLSDRQYYTRIENALLEAVRIAVRLEIADGSITELQQIVAEQARLEREFSEKLKGVYI